MIRCQVQGNFKKITKFLNRNITSDMKGILEKYGKKGVEALSAATPVDTGLTAKSWFYEVSINNGNATIRWYNTNESDGIPIVILLQYGHATRDGGFVEGVDFINPAMKPIFEGMAKEMWREVTGNA